MNKVLAFDFGASSGRAMLGTYENEKISITEIHRFENNPITENDTLFWDIDCLVNEIKIALKKAGNVDSIAFDTWGVDFGLLDENGELISKPVHYRDKRTNGIFDYAFNKLDKNEFYNITGNQFMEINTVFQLCSLIKNQTEDIKEARYLLFMPNLFTYLLSSVKSTEYSIASTSQIMDMRNKTWSQKVISTLNIPNILPEIMPIGSIVGELTDNLSQELGVKKAKLIAVASHDTQSAIASVPTNEKDFIFISCGTWSLFGTELNEPIINEKSAKLNLTNEIGVENTYDFLKNIIGLWLIQESRRQYKREGKDYSYADLERLALECEPLKCFIDPDAPEFVPQGDIPQRVRDFCKKTGQYVPQTVGEVMRCIYESLAMKYRYAFNQIKECTSKSYSTIHIVGGGTKDRLLCQMTANACDCKVLAGPIEATVLGNVAVQLIALGEIKNIAQAREIIKSSENILEYKPIDNTIWSEKYSDFIKIINTEA